MIYFTADTHISHDGILRITDRGKFFSSIEEHDNYIIDKINSVVDTNDILYHLGDIGSKSGIEKFVRECDAEIRLVIGNHDLKNRSYQYFRHNFIQAEHELQVKCNNERFVLTHYPMLCWDQSFRGSINLFGHVHSHLSDWINQFRPKAKMLDVGIDSAKKLLGDYAPFSIEDVVTILSGKLGHSPDVNKFWITKIEQPHRDILFFNIYYDYDLDPIYLPKNGTTIYINNIEFVIFDSLDENSFYVGEYGYGQYIPKIGDKVIWR